MSERPTRFKTRITELFGIEYPILCGGLMWLSDARYVAASVNAGGMGFITARTFPDPDVFRAELRKCRDLTGGRPFGVVMIDVRGWPLTRITALPGSFQKPL